MSTRENTPAPQSLPEGIVNTYENAAWLDAATKLSILIPTYKDDPSALITALSQCGRSDEIEIIVYDDGGNNPEQIAQLESLCGALECATKIVSNKQNVGRAKARNYLLDYARNDWVLLLDADMLPDDHEFLARYLNEASSSVDPKLVVGGFSLNQTPETPEMALHRWQSIQSECMSVDIRNQQPGRYVFTSNVMAHKDLFTLIPFDEAFTGWGWEDVDWGLRIANAYPVIHIDNTASHLGLDTVDDLMRKYGGSGPNFKRICQKHPEALSQTKLYKLAHILKPIPGKSVMKYIASGIAKNQSFMPVALRGQALKLWRALVYAGSL